MQFKPYITDFGDQDVYKFYMQYAVLRHYPEALVTYSLILRDTEIRFPDGFAAALRDQVAGFASLRCSGTMIECLFAKVPCFDRSYAGYLERYRFNPGEVTVGQEGGALSVTIHGPWHSAILWEVPLLATISELYYSMTRIPDDTAVNTPRWEEKFRNFDAMKLAVIEFGTRRRKSKAVQEAVIDAFIRVAPAAIKGTSNVMFAMQFGIPVIGTQAHEWFMFHAARYGVENANATALDKWVDTYRGALGIALTDTYTTDDFFSHFNLFHSKLFDGLRQDSGDPVAFAGKAINHYLRQQIVLPNGMIPKTLVFSDSIDSLDKLARIEAATHQRIFTSYGIGTWLSNDIVLRDGSPVKPLNMVIKMTAASPDGRSPAVPCFKLTDSPEKQTGGI